MQCLDETINVNVDSMSSFLSNLKGSLQQNSFKIIERKTKKDVGESLRPINFEFGQNRRIMSDPSTK